MTSELSSQSWRSAEVSRQVLEARLAGLQETVQDPREGLFGPGSKVWEVNREAVLFLGGGRAALLQLAHPWVAEAVFEHSRTREDPLGRFHRTFYNVFAMVFGDLETAVAAARRVHAIHQRITGVLRQGGGRWRSGSRYLANDPDALLWVHATLWETSVHVFELVVRPLTEVEKERYYGESRRFAHLFGLDDRQLPADWSSFLAYNEEMWSSDRLAVGERAAELVRFLFAPQRRLTAPFLRRLRVATAGLLPERLRREFGLTFGTDEQRSFQRTLRWLRRSHRLLPPRLRFVPAYLEAQRRLEGRTRRDPIGRVLTRLYTGRAR